MGAIDAHPFPRGALIAASVLVGASLLSVTAIRIAEWGEGPPGMTAGMEDTAPVLRERTISFALSPDDSLAVRDASTGEEIARFAAGEAGFIRGVLRGLGRDRLQHAVAFEAPYRIKAFADGRLALEDTATQRRIDAGAFGRDNRDAFQALLDPAGPTATLEETRP